MAIAVTDSFLVNNKTVYNQFDPLVVPLKDGKFMVVWIDDRIPVDNIYDYINGKGHPQDILARVYDANGQPLGRNFALTNSSVSIGFYHDLDVQELPNGGYAFAWVQTDSSEDIIMSRVVSADGERVGPAVGISLLLVNQNGFVGDLGIEAVGSDGYRVVVDYGNEGAEASFTVENGVVIDRTYSGDGLDNPDPVLTDANYREQNSGGTTAFLSNDRYVVVSEGQDGSGTGIYAQLFSKSGIPLPSPDASGSEAFSRAGTVGSLTTGNEQIAGVTGANTFFVDVDAVTGSDTLINFGSNDIILSTRALATLVRDGSGRIDLDGIGGSADSIQLSSDLRLVGEVDRLAIYADASVKPVGSVELSALKNDAVQGTSGSDVFFIDTALGLKNGSDKISNFGLGDRIVTTTAIFDSNDDGRIRADTSDFFTLFSDRALGGLKVYNTNDKAVSNLTLVDTEDRNGVTYYVYAAAGDQSSIADLIFG